MTDLTAPIALIACAVALIAWGITARKLIRERALHDETFKLLQRAYSRCEILKAETVAAVNELTATKAQLTRLTTRGKDGKFVKVAG